MPSTWLQRARRLPCLALTLALCVALLSACLPRTLCLCARPERLRFALRCSLAAHARTALRLAVVLVHRSWRLKLTHPPPPPTSPPRLRTPRRLCALVRSQVGIPGPASVARACRAARAASLSHCRKGSLVALRSARRTSRACAAGGISRLEISSVQGGRAGVDVSYCLRIALFQTRGFGEIWRSGTISQVSYCGFVMITCSCISCWMDIVQCP